MVLRNWLRRFVTGDPVNKVCDTQNLNRIANILEDLEVVGRGDIRAAISKPTDAEGLGWVITISGGGTPTAGVPLVLASTGLTANSDHWARGDVDAQNRPYAPQFVPYRLVWDENAHCLRGFERKASYDADGSLVSVPAEVETTTVTFVSEMP